MRTIILLACLLLAGCAPRHYQDSRSIDVRIYERDADYAYVDFEARRRREGAR